MMLHDYLNKYVDNRVLDYLNEQHNWTLATMNSNLMGYSLPTPPRLKKWCEAIAKIHNKNEDDVLFEALEIIRISLKL